MIKQTSMKVLLVRKRHPLEKWKICLRQLGRHVKDQWEMERTHRWHLRKQPERAKTHSVLLYVGCQGLCSKEIRKQWKTKMEYVEGWVWLPCPIFLRCRSVYRDLMQLKLWVESLRKRSKSKSETLKRHPSEGPKHVKEVKYDVAASITEKF